MGPTSLNFFSPIYISYVFLEGVFGVPERPLLRLPRCLSHL